MSFLAVTSRCNKLSDMTTDFQCLQFRSIARGETRNAAYRIPSEVRERKVNDK
jgi:hypothetical protein